MPRNEIRLIFERIETLEREIASFVPIEPKTTEFRADLAGLLVVAIAASYESSVKETLTSYAAGHHAEFATFAQNQFKKLNSRINLNDLYGYARTFGDPVHKKFSELIRKRKEWYSQRVGLDYTKSYEQILSWRHDFAHAGVRNTTIEEALKTHKLARQVLYTFDEAFHQVP